MSSDMNPTAVKLSVTIITLNEEKNIERCIRSVQGLADEILVIDSYSTDRTQEICEQLGVRFIQHSFEGYVVQKNYALHQATHDCILSLDADEALSPQLYESIRAVKKNWTHDAYQFNRLTNYCGHWIKHCGWYPDAKLRLWNRLKGQWSGISIHESIKLSDNASVQHLKGDLLHYSYYSVADHYTQINKFTSISAQEYYQKGKKTISFLHLVLYPPLTFLSRFIFKLGFLDGYAGFLVCKSTAYTKFLKYVKLHELNNNAASNSDKKL